MGNDEAPGGQADPSVAPHTPHYDLELMCLKCPDLFKRLGSQIDCGNLGTLVKLMFMNLGVNRNIID